MHGCISLQGGQAQVAAFSLECHRVSYNVAETKARLQLAVVNVPVLAQVNVEHPVEHEALQMANEAGGDDRDVAFLCHDPRLDVVELQAGMITNHRA